MTLHPTRRIGAVLVGLLVLATPAEAQKRTPAPDVQALLTTDLRGAADHPLTGRYEGSALLAQTTKAFDQITLPTGPAEGTRSDKSKAFASTVTLQGRVTRSIYVAPPGRSAIEVLTNFEQAVVSKGFATVFQCSREVCGGSFPRLKYRRDRPDTKVVGQDYEHLRTLMLDAVFDELVDVRYRLLKQSTPGGDTHVRLRGPPPGRNARQPFPGAVGSRRRAGRGGRASRDGAPHGGGCPMGPHANPPDPRLAPS